MSTERPILAGKLRHSWVHELGSGCRAWRKFQDRGWSGRVTKGINAKEEQGETSRCAYTGNTGGREADERKGKMGTGRRAGIW